jgi:hypothetical protein
MASDEPQAGRVVVTITAPGGDQLELVAYPDGGCGIVRHGMPVANATWTPCRMEECAGELLRLAGLMGGCTSYNARSMTAPSCK